MDEPNTLGTAPPSAGLMPAGVMSNVNGILPIMNNAALDKRSAIEQASEENSQPLLVGLAAHVNGFWQSARHAKQDIEQRMLRGIRQRRGEYDPEILAEIRKGGGTEVYMMLTSNKCRAASAWLRDTLLGIRDEKPWTIDSTTLPTLSQQDQQQVTQMAIQQALQLEQELGPFMDMEGMVELRQGIADQVLEEVRESSKKKVRRMEDKMEDQLSEGGFKNALCDFIDDLTTFPAAVLKGPVIRNKPRLQWIQGADGQFTPDIKDQLVKEWERVDPFMIYPAPLASDINDGDLIERHRLSRADLEELIGVDGYSDNAIRAVLEEYGRNGLMDWLYVDSERAAAEGKQSLYVMANTDGRIDALQYWGSVQGQSLIEWGMDEKDVPDPLKNYNCEVWLIGRWVIKATLNYDPFGRKPYYKTSYEEIPGVFWGNAVTDLARDSQTVCNAAARALVNNMGIASGPQVSVSVDRLPSGEDITHMYPWKIWQVTSDPYGSTAPAVDFFQPSILASELMGIYERFSVMADEYTGIPRYMTGDAATGGAGRTASGMSMLMTNAGKSIKQVISNIDQYVIEPLIQRLYYYNMKYEADPDLKGDVNIVARGANALVVKEQAQMRRNEFLQIVLNSPVVSQIVGATGIAALLREGAKSLDMNVDEIIPEPDIIAARQKQAQAMQQQMMQMQAIQGQQQPQAQIGSGQQLMDGSPTTNNFQPRQR